MKSKTPFLCRWFHWPKWSENSGLWFCRRCGAITKVGR